MEDLVLHIGYPKTATSWLQRLVFNNREIHLKTLQKGLVFKHLIYPDDLDYNEDVARKEILSEVEKIEKEGFMPVISHENLVGFIASGGYYNYSLAKRLNRLFDGAKVIMVIRNQHDMIYSSYVQYVRMGGKCGINRFLNPPADSEIPLFKHEYFEYHKLIKLYHDLFGKKNVLVLPYELFINEPREYVEEIAHFMNIILPDHLDFDEIQNKSMRGTGIALKRFSNYFVSRYESINADVPVPVSQKTAELIKGACNKVAEIMPDALNNKVTRQIKTTIRKNVQGMYANSNSETAKITGIPLKQYGYEVHNTMDEQKKKNKSKAQAVDI